MPFKFEGLEVCQLTLEYIELIYEPADKLTDKAKFNLGSQMTRAVISIALNVAEGSTGQSDPEQNRFLGMPVRSLIETVACQRIIRRRNDLSDISLLERADSKAQDLAKRLHAFRGALSPSNGPIKEEPEEYRSDDI